MRMTILAGLALVLLAAGCGSDDEAAAARAAASRPQLSGPVTYERGGGLKGRRDRLVVQPDGSATLTVRDKTKSMTLTDKELATLADDLDQADLGSLPADSTIEDAGARHLRLPRELRRRRGHHRRHGHARSAARAHGPARRAGRPLRAVAPQGTTTGAIVTGSWTV